MQHELIIKIFIGVNIAIFAYAFWEKRKFFDELSSEIRRVVGTLFHNDEDEIQTQKIVNHAEQAFKGSRLFDRHWRKYKQNLMENDLVTKDIFFSSADSDYFFNISSLMTSSRLFVSFPIWNAIPQILTSVGIIGTFVTMILAFSRINEVSDSLIKVLVSELSIAFISSAVGVGLAAIFLMLERRYTKNANTQIHRITSWLDYKFPPLAVEKILNNQTHVLKNLSAEISASIASGFNEMKGGLGAAMADMMDDSTKATIKESIVVSFQGLSSMISELRDESKAIKTEYETIRAEKAKLFDNIKQINDEQKKIQLDIVQTSSELKQNLTALQSTLAPLAEVAKQVEVINSVSGKMADSVKDITQASMVVKSSLDKTSETTVKTLELYTEQLNKMEIEYGKLTSGIDSWVKKTNESLEKNLNTFDGEISKVLRQSVALGDSFSSGVVSMERSVEKLVKQLADGQ